MVSNGMTHRNWFGIQVLNENEVDASQWLTIPEIADRVKVSVSEAGEMLDLLGLRWKGPNSRYTSKVPTAQAVRWGYVIEVDVGKDRDLRRWNYPKIMELLHASATD